MVTGGSRGLGLLLAGRLVEVGCAVTVAARDAAELAEAEGLLTDGGPWAGNAPRSAT